MTLTEKGRRTRERILQAAADLLHGQGINATSAGDVMRASGTGKGQFYQHFSSWEALVAEVFAGHVAFVESLPPFESWDDVERWMLTYHELQRSFEFERGCPLGTAAYALHADQKTVRDPVTKAFTAIRDNISRFLRREQRAGRYDADADPKRLAEFAIATVQGGLLLSLLYKNGKPLRGVIREALTHLRSFGIEA